MQLTSELLARYAGGQLEIQNQNEGYLYRGEVERAWIEGDDLCVRFVWFAKGEGYPSLPERWVSEPDLDYKASLTLVSASEIGEGRLSFRVMLVGELGVFFPPDGSKLDPTKVEGLVLV